MNRLMHILQHIFKYMTNVSHFKFLKILHILFNNQIVNFYTKQKRLRILSLFLAIFKIKNGNQHQC